MPDSAADRTWILTVVGDLRGDIRDLRTEIGRVQESLRAQAVAVARLGEQLDGLRGSARRWGGVGGFLGGVLAGIASWWGTSR